MRKFLVNWDYGQQVELNKNFTIYSPYYDAEALAKFAVLHNVRSKEVFIDKIEKVEVIKDAWEQASERNQFKQFSRTLHKKEFELYSQENDVRVTVKETEYTRNGLSESDEFGKGHKVVLSFTNNPDTGDYVELSCVYYPAMIEKTLYKVQSTIAGIYRNKQYRSYISACVFHDLILLNEMVL